MSADFNYTMDELDFTKALRQVRRVYFIHYSQPNLVGFPTCRTFVGNVLEFFMKQKDDKNPPLQWSCCQEPYANDGKHYHMVIRFEKQRRSTPIKKYMIQNFGVNLHFFPPKYWLCCSI